MQCLDTEKDLSPVHFYPISRKIDEIDEKENLKIYEGNLCQVHWVTFITSWGIVAIIITIRNYRIINQWGGRNYLRVRRRSSRSHIEWLYFDTFPTRKAPI